MNFTAQYINHNNYLNYCINTRYIILSCIILSVTIPLCCESSYVQTEWTEGVADKIISPTTNNVVTSKSDGERIRNIRSSSSSSSAGRTGRGWRGQDGKPLEVYFGIAAPANNQVVLKAFNKTLASISTSFLAGEYGVAYKNVALQPFFIELPENEKFTSSLLVSSCAALNGRKVAGLAVLGRSEAAATAALAAAQAGIPVLRAAPKPTAFHTTLAENIHPLESRLEITARETLQALRSLLLHTHWHSFTILADFKVSSSIALRKDLVSIINSPPLSPTILSLPASITQQSLFRRLADVSRLTRGVVVLFCNIQISQKVLDQAKRLNMLDGHFVWLWIDTDNSLSRLKYTENENSNFHDQFTSQGPDPFFEIESIRKAKEERHAADQRERHLTAAKRMEETVVADRNKRETKSIDKNKLDGAQQVKEDVNTDDDQNKDTIDFNEGFNNYTRRKGGDVYKRIYFNEYTSPTPIGLRSTLRDPNLIYIKNRELINDKSLVYRNNKIKDGNFRDVQSDLINYLSINNKNNDKNDKNDKFDIITNDNKYKENDFININLKEGVESSKIALNHITKNSKTPESNYKLILKNNHDYDDIDFNDNKNMHNNINKYDIMYISDNKARDENIVVSSKGDVFNVDNIRQHMMKRSESSVPLLGDNVNNIKATVRSLSVFNKFNSPQYNNVVGNRMFSAAVAASAGVHVAEKRTERLWSFNKVDGEDALNSAINITSVFENFPIGLLALRPLPSKSDRQLIRGAVRAMSGALRKVLSEDSPHWESLSRQTASCWNAPSHQYASYSAEFVKELNHLVEDSLAGNKFSRDGSERLDKSLVGSFEILNLVPETDKPKDSNQINNNDKLKWRSVGRVTGKNVQIDTIVWPGGDIIVSGLSAQARSVFRIVTALAPPFVMEGELDEDGQCLRGLPCHRVLTSDKDNLTLVFNEMETQERMEEEAEEVIQGSFFPHLKYHSNYEPLSEKFLPFQNKYKYRTNCCYGLTMDLLENIAEELEFDFHLYIVSDGLFGHRKLTRKHVHKRDFKVHYRETKDPISKSDFRKEFRNGVYGNGITDEDQGTITSADMKWNGIVGDLISGAAHMSFAALSVSSARSEVIDFSVPYFFSGVSFLAAPPEKSETPLLAFLLPFSPELWITIFTSLNVTAIAVAIYEWLSPFGLNPWGRQRSKNFSMSSALWVMWGLLCGHLVAFKAPKSWPNKFLINVWGGFSVIFVASYTANIAALYAGLFFQNAVADYSDKNLLTLRVGAPKASAAEYYIQRSSQPLWDHMKKYALADVEDGIRKLKNGSLDLLIADTPILDYHRATDHGCKLQRIGEAFYDDTYAVAMAKGFPLKDSISALISKYLANGYMDILQEKWYGGLPCFKLRTDFGVQPRPLGVAAVAGVFILLGVGMGVGCLILLVEHLFYRYTLPILRHKPKGTIWRSRNIMFFSQKLYRFINCVELVSPHHAARELVHTLRQGQITSLFQKSVKRKEHEQRRRRKSKAQFFEMIQEIRRVQQEERDQPLEAVTEIDSEPNSPTESNTMMSPPKKLNFLSPTGAEGKVKSPLKSKIFNKELFKSPRAKNKKRKQSMGGLNVRRFSTDSVFSSHSMLRFENTSVAIGRRLSKDTACLSSSPPDINSRRSSYMDFDKLGSRSPNVSSDSLDAKDKVATIPKYRGKQYLDSSPSNYGSVSNKNRLGLGSSFGQSSGGYPLEARSFQNVSEQEAEDKSEDPQTSTSVDDLHSKPEFPHSELQKKHKKTFDELQEQLNKRGELKKHGKVPVRRCVSQQAESSGGTVKKSHQIKIQIEDHSSPPPKETFSKQRHKSLDSEETLHEERRRRPRTPECFPKDASRTIDKSLGESSSEQGKDLHLVSKSRMGSSPDPSCRLTHEASLPPAPPYPNVVPRTSDGKSPLERLTKEELVLLWRSSESELRSHFLTALREKENTEPP